MDQTPSTVDELRLWLLLSLASGSIGFSSMDKPAMAESTLVKGTDMLWMRWKEEWERREKRREKRREEGRGEMRQVTWL